MCICETCRKQVRPASEPGVVFAVELVSVAGFSEDAHDEVAEGRGVFFHERCYPVGSTRHRQKPMPTDIGDGDD